MANLNLKGSTFLGHPPVQDEKIQNHTSGPFTIARVFQLYVRSENEINDTSDIYSSSLNVT